MDPREVLNLPAEFTVEQLRHHYKALARQLHPDKRRVSEQQATEMFQLLTEAYRALLEEIERKRAQAQERPFYELREAYRRDDGPGSSSGSGISGSGRDTVEFLRARPGGGSGGGSGVGGRRPSVPVASGQAFDVARFNAAFDKSRAPDPVVDGGYERWMKETQPEQAARLMRDAERRRNEERQRSLGAVRLYTEPEPMQLTNRSTVAYTELGSTGVDDYSCSRGEVRARHSIQYTDYRLAHSTERLAEEEDFAEAILRTSRELGSIKALQAHRASISYEMTAEDQRAYDAALRDRDRRERERVHALSRYDRDLLMNE